MSCPLSGVNIPSTPLRGAAYLPGRNTMAVQRVLLVHLTSNGDCLMATTVARQIKNDYPGCHLTWAISLQCKQVIENNPFVDEIWSVEYAPYDHPHDDVWRRTKAEALRRQKSGQFDLVLFTQIFPENFNNFDGTTRSSIFRSYPGKITVPVDPVLHLLPSEVERVAKFASDHALGNYKNVILFECSPASHQSPMTQEKALRISAQIAEKRHDTAIIISSHKSFQSPTPAVMDASALSFRENAELSKYCTLLLGCSSGITWLLTSNWANKLPTIQFLGRDPCWHSFASVKYDHRFWGLATDHILETDLHSDGDVVALVLKYLDQGNFEGFQDAAFMPSIEQIYNLHQVTRDRLDARRVLENFIERNPQIPVNRAAYYYRLLHSEMRGELAAVLPSTLASTKRTARLLCRLIGEISSRRSD